MQVALLVDGIGIGYCNSWIKMLRLKRAFGMDRGIFRTDDQAYSYGHNMSVSRNIRIMTLSIDVANAIETKMRAWEQDNCSHWGSIPALRPQDLNQLS